MTGDGVQEFFDAVDASRDEYEKCVHRPLPSRHNDLMARRYREYLPELQRARAQREQTLKAAKEESMSRMMKDLAVDRATNPSAFENDTWGDEDDDEVNIIDRSTFPTFWCRSLINNYSLTGEERWPGQYIDVTRARRHPEEDINWLRPG